MARTNCDVNRGRNPLNDWKATLSGVLAGALAGSALGLSGFFIVRIPDTHAMGLVMFLLVPVASGFAIAMVSHKLKWISAAAVLATIGRLAILTWTGMETPLCALLALPWLAAGLALGICLGYLFQRVMAKPGDNVTFTSVVFLSWPLLIFAGHRVELSTLIHPRQEVVTSTIRLAADPTLV